MATRTRVEPRPLQNMLWESAVIPARAGKLLLRHFPQLVTLICLGLAGRQAVIWAAVWISDFSSFAASLLMPLAPLCVMLSIIVCLWLLRPSLPFLSATFPDRADTPKRTRLLSAGGMLISFLTVYATHGMLREDIAAFRRAATFDEYQNQYFDADFSRAFVHSTAALITLVAGTLVLRKIVGYFALAEKGLGFTYLSVYLEVLWMTTVSVFLTNQLNNVQEWALTRKSIYPAYQRYQDVMEGVEENAGWLADVWTWLSDKLPAFNQLVTIPIAWLTLGAVVFGTSLAAKRATDAAKEQPEAADKEPPAEPAGRRMRTRVKDAASGEAKHAVEEALQPVAGPLKTTWKGLKTLSRAGLIPMTTFCVVFMLSSALELGVVELGRLILGPQDTQIGYSLGAFVLIVARAVYLIAVVCLIASGLDYFLRNSYSPEESALEPEGAAAASSGGKKTAGSGSTIVA